MSNADPFKQLENRPVLASYATYAEAQFAVDKLSDAKFPRTSRSSVWICGSSRLSSAARPGDGRH